jgi:hypothetical protein
MQFIKQIEHHLTEFDTEAKAEIARFIAFLRTKFVEPGPAVVGIPEAPVATDTPSTPAVAESAPDATTATETGADGEDHGE